MPKIKRQSAKFVRVVRVQRNVRSLHDLRRKVDYHLCEYRGVIDNAEYRRGFESAPGKPVTPLPQIDDVRMD